MKAKKSLVSSIVVLVFFFTMCITWVKVSADTNEENSVIRMTSFTVRDSVFDYVAKEDPLTGQKPINFEIQFTDSASSMVFGKITLINVADRNDLISFDVSPMPYVSPDLSTIKHNGQYAVLSVELWDDLGNTITYFNMDYAVNLSQPTYFAYDFSGCNLDVINVLELQPAVEGNTLFMTTFTVRDNIFDYTAKEDPLTGQKPINFEIQFTDTASSYVNGIIYLVNQEDINDVIQFSINPIPYIAPIVETITKNATYDVLYIDLWDDVGNKMCYYNPDYLGGVDSPNVIANDFSACQLQVINVPVNTNTSTPSSTATDIPTTQPAVKQPPVTPTKKPATTPATTTNKPATSETTNPMPSDTTESSNTTLVIVISVIAAAIIIGGGTIGYVFYNKKKKSK